MTQVHEVWRGDQLLTLDSRLKTIGGMDWDQARWFVNQVHTDYSEIDFVNSFHPDKKILLVGAGFFGPVGSPLSNSVASCSYTVRMRLDMVSSEGQEEKVTTLATIERNVDFSHTLQDGSNIGNLGKVFYVDFDQPVLLFPNVIQYSLAFRLRGPPSLGLDPTKLRTEVESNGVTFFFWPGSKQMPVLRFMDYD